MTPLIVAATPIGNPLDASARLKEAIASADLIAAEDSRKFARLAADLEVRYSGKVLSFFEANEGARIEGLIERITAGEKVLLVSDAGIPAISDPGYRLISECINRNLDVIVLPGPSSILTALIHSGFSSHSFLFEGFVPRTSGARNAFYSRLSEEARTTIVFESPHRVRASLQAALEIITDSRDVVLCRELTKKYEEVVRGSLTELLEWAKSREESEGIKGELTLVFGPIKRLEKISPEDVISRVSELMAQGRSTRDAVSQVSQELSLAKRYVYDLVISSKE
ncbi:MAG: 16S rRNA (cytidine(1402)-2'-O)-methyltransferase [Actinobacteria bacterium]|jgi:16S rRNA (cytidine1402-2'-O)-methyltransferase|nr:16S rRNA (cytidine(1402)-2'-O)-methyltransferase [Actinomycetota bacterium]